MNRTAAWVWTGAGAIERACEEDSVEQVWLNPDLPEDAPARVYRTGVEIYLYFADAEKLNGSLEVIGRFFGRDSVLAAIRRKNGTARVLFYTSAPKALVDNRYLSVRGVLRPIAIGVRIAEEPAWETLEELRVSLGSLRGPALAAEGGRR